MKKIKYIYLLCFALVLAVFSSCEDESKYDNTAIKVTQVYLEDHKSSQPDRPVDFARLGQLIRIEGSGFLGMQKIYVNGYDTYFNVAYITDNSMLLSIHSKTPVMEADTDVRNTIRFVKKGAEFTFPLIIRAATPFITSISNSLPKAGEKVTVYGSNLHETTKLTLPGGVEVITGIESDEEGKWYSFTMPTGLSEGGSIYSEGANGKAATPGYFNFTNCMVLDFDSDENGKQGYWSWSETGSMINADDLVNDPLNSGRGKCLQLIPERILTGANGGVLPGKARAIECWTEGGDGGLDDWTRMYNEAYGITASTPLAEVAFQFDIYVPEAWSSTGHIQLSLFNNFNFGGIGSDDDGKKHTAFFVPYIQDGQILPFQTTGWQTVTIPFSKFGYYADKLADKEVTTPPTFQAVVEDRLAATYKNFGMGLVNTDFTYQGLSITSVLMNQRIYIDNWRVVPYANIEISDFNDEAAEEE